MEIPLPFMRTFLLVFLRHFLLARRASLSPDRKRRFLWKRRIGHDLASVRSQNLLLNTFVDLLKLDPSLDLRRRAPNGLQGDLSIRGATFGQTLVLLNGQRLSDPRSGHHSWICRAAASVESIEVLRGRVRRCMDPTHWVAW